MKAENRKREGEMPDPFAGPNHPVKDYGHASPREIMADIEQTRAHMDETLSMLGRKIRPGRGGKAVLSLVGGSLLALAGIAGYLLVRRTGGGGLMRHAFKHAHHARRAAPWLMRTPGIIEQALLAKKLAMAARKGRPAIIVVEPRKV